MRLRFSYRFSSVPASGCTGPPPKIVCVCSKKITLILLHVSSYYYMRVLILLMHYVLLAFPHEIRRILTHHFLLACLFLKK